MDELNHEIERILKHLDKERWIAFSKNESATTFKAKDKLRAYGLIERHGKLSWQLTKDGYRAVELGGYNEWLKTHEKIGFSNKAKAFFSKFWWSVIIPIVVGVAIWALTERKDPNTKSKETEPTSRSIPQKELSKQPAIENDLKAAGKEDTNRVYLQSFRPVELFNGELIITLNNSIDAVNDNIELKLVQKSALKHEIFSKRKIGDIIHFNKYIISLLSLERNISTYDLIIKVEAKN